MTPQDLTGLLVGALGGAAVGVERQWSGHAEGPGARFAGIRTFTMLGGIGALASVCWTAGLTATSVVILTGAVALVVAGYVAASRFDVDGTTEVAALVVLAAGMLAGIGFIRLACGTVAITTLLLAEKTQLHALVKRIDDIGLRSGVRFAVLALVLLPLLPEGPYGPFGGVRPRELWAIVLLFSGLSFAGYVARRLFGPRNGYTVTGILGGAVSSTNVTLTFAQLSRSEPALARTLAFGAIGATAMLYPRLLAATAILNSAVMVSLLPYLIPPAVIAIAITAFGLSRADSSPIESVAPSNPLQLRQALQFAVLIQIVLVVVHVARERWGAAGIFSSAAALGLTDVDALTVSMARDVARTVSTGVAAAAIAIGVLTNTATKLALALMFGGPRFRVITGTALALILSAGGIALALVGSRSVTERKANAMEETPYGLKVSLTCGYEEAIARATDALKSQGFGVLTTIDVKQTLKAKLDRDFRKYMILGACNPPLAHRALEAELEVGLLLPCNVIVYETSPSSSVVSAMAPLAALGIVGDNAALAQVAQEADARLRVALASLELPNAERTLLAT